jgi:glycosyltransferase involved in cell wall biosynthesis
MNEGSSYSVKATVLIVTYNHESFVEKAIESARAQQCDFPFEILVADDCSTDGTRAILNRYRASGDPRIRFFLPDQNLGSFGNHLFIAALAQCRGEYVAWLDGDDYWTDDAKLQTMVRYLDERPQLNGAFHPVAVHGSGSDGAPTFVSPPEVKLVYRFDDLLWSNVVPSSAIVYRRSTLPSLEPYADVLCLDWVLHLLQARSGGIGYVDRVMGVYRVHDAGVWSSLPAVRRMEELTGFMDRAPELFQYDSRPYRRRMARQWAELALAERAAHRGAEAREAARNAWRNDRHSMVALLTLGIAFTFPAPLLRLFRRVSGGIGRRLRRWRRMEQVTAA